MWNDGDSLWGSLNLKKYDLLDFKKSISSLFQDIGEMTLYALNETQHLKGIVISYLEYFDLAENGASEQNFFTEILVPADNIMNTAVSEVLKISEANEMLHTRISREIFGLCQIIKNSGNHSKGESGLYLPIDRIEACFDEYNGIRNWGRMIHDKYLTGIRAAIIESNNEIKNELMKSLSQTRTLLHHLEAIERTSFLMMNNLQMEDVERQNLERLTFLIEDIDGNFLIHEAALKEEIGSERLQDVFSYMIRTKTAQIEKGLRNIFSDYNRCMTDIISEFSACTASRSVSDSSEQKLGNMKSLESISRKRKSLEKGFSIRVKKIIEMKKSLSRLLFRAMHQNSEIKNLVQTNFTAHSESDYLIDRIRNFFAVINEQTEDIISVYNRNLSEQEKILQDIVFTIGRVSMKFSEAVKYNRLMAGEIERRIEDIKRIAEVIKLKLSSKGTIDNFIQTLLLNSTSLTGETDKRSLRKTEEYSDDIKIIRKHYLKNEIPGDYKNMMLLSFFSEFAPKPDEGMIFF